MKIQQGKEYCKIEKGTGCPRNSWPKRFTSPGQAVSTGNRQEPADLDMLETLARLRNRYSCSHIRSDASWQMRRPGLLSEASPEKAVVLGHPDFWSLIPHSDSVRTASDVLKTRPHNSMPYILLQTSVMPLISGFAVSLMHVLNVALHDS